MALIFTTEGDVDESLLVKTTGGSETETEKVAWTEYRLNDVVVRRDVDMVLKQPLSLFGEAST